MYFTTLSVWQYTGNLAINNIFIPSKIRIVFEGKHYGKHQRKHSLNSEDFVTLINMLRILYFVYIFTPQNSVQKKCIFLCIFPQFQTTENWGPYPVSESSLMPTTAARCHPAVTSEICISLDSISCPLRYVTNLLLFPCTPSISSCSIGIRHLHLSFSPTPL